MTNVPITEFSCPVISELPGNRHLIPGRRTAPMMYSARDRYDNHQTVMGQMDECN